MDPWLRGAQSDVTRFLSQQWHAIESKVQTIKEVEQLIQSIEEETLENNNTAIESSEKPSGRIDAVVVSHEFTDHMHKDTLLEVASSVPVFATPKAASTIRSWKHFDMVQDTLNLSGPGRNWRETSRAPLPEWLGICRVAYEGSDMLYYHSAIMITFEGPQAGDNGEKVEAVIYTPHGIKPEDLKSVSNAQPPIQTLALLHGLHDISLGPQLNLGAHNGLKTQRLLNAKYWIGTHDEIKRGGGIVSWFLKRKVLTVKEAIEEQIKQNGGDKADTELESMSDVQFVDLKNGESLVLE